MKNSALASSFASPWTCRFACLAASFGFALVSVSYGQQGYQVQGPYAFGGPPGAGGGMSSQPAYTDGAGQPDPRYQSSPYSPYSQQPAYQQQRRPAAPKTPKPNYNPQQPYGQIQPYPYPGSQVAQPNRQPLGPDYQYNPPKPSPQRHGNMEYLAQQVELLKENDRRQERRLDVLESKATVGGYAASNPDPERYLKHKVDYSDSLQGIAIRYGVSVSEIKSVNHLSSNLLTEGQVLRIPDRNRRRSDGIGTGTLAVRTSGGSHIVQRGDSLGKIAKQYGVSKSALINANNVRNPDVLAVGQKLTIPGLAGKSSAIKNSSRKSTTSKGDGGHFVVKAINPKPVLIHPEGTPQPMPVVTSGVITAPSGSRGVTSYRVEPGDTIDSVAKSYGTNAAEIQRKNKLSTLKLPPVGEEIVVPLPGSVSS